MGLEPALQGLLGRGRALPLHEGAALPRLGPPYGRLVPVALDIKVILTPP
jgi:hypothetical protein